MNRQQIFELETEYILKDLLNDILDLANLIDKSKKRNLIPHNLRYLWPDKCYKIALKQLKEIRKE